MNERLTGGDEAVVAGCAVRGTRPRRTIFVHLDAGSIVEVTDVVRLRLSQTELILDRDAAAQVMFPRASVYYACCEHDSPPSQT